MTEPCGYTWPGHSCTVLGPHTAHQCTCGKTPDGNRPDQFVSCDQCNARAYIHVKLPNGGTLAYCAHHGHQHTPALHAAGATVLDLTHMMEGP